MAKYSNPIPDFADVMTVQEFKEQCEYGLFIDNDGFGCPVKNDKEDGNLWIYPSELNKIPEDATHIAWYNK